MCQGNKSFAKEINAALQDGNPARAAQLCRERIALRPEDAQSLRYLSQIEGAAGHTEAALRLGQRACRAAPDDPLAHQALGQALAGAGDWVGAAGSFRDCTRLAPQASDGWYNFGIALRRIGDNEGALNAWKQVLRRDPKHADAWFAMARLLDADSQPVDALGCYERAARFQPALLPLLGDRRLARGASEAALSAYTTAWEQGIELVRSGIGRGQVLEVLGQREEALAAYREVLKIEPNHAEALALLLALTEPDNCDTWRERAQAALRSGATSDSERAVIGYGLVRHHDRSGDPVAAVEAARAANSARRKEAGVANADALAARVAGIRARYDEAFFRERKRVSTNTGSGPVWIVGMPRSGTTLVEQILAAHPKVHGAGELEDLPRLAGRIAGSEETEMIAAAAEVDAQMSETLTEEYMCSLTAWAPGEAVHWVDKTPFNFFHLAFAAVLFPQGRVIHCRRDPRDMALSIWLANFAPSQRYATDLYEIARMWQASEEVMEHWQQVLPLAIHTLNYEDLVARPKEQTHRLLQFLDLEWEPACLRFHEQSRAVNTPSRWQVRQPLYTSAIGRWRAYAEALPELSAAFSGGSDLYGLSNAR